MILELVFWNGYLHECGGLKVWGRYHEPLSLALNKAPY